MNIERNLDLPLSDLMAAQTGSFQIVDRDRNGTTANLYTGGTTGNPKGAQPLTECYPAVWNQFSAPGKPPLSVSTIGQLKVFVKFALCSLYYSKIYPGEGILS
jgi:hypothetical protein